MAAAEEHRAADVGAGATNSGIDLSQAHRPERAPVEHPRSNDYPGQSLYVVEIDGYAWVVPSRDEGDTRVLITAYPNRKFTRRYLGEP